MTCTGVSNISIQAASAGMQAVSDAASQDGFDFQSLMNAGAKKASYPTNDYSAKDVTPSTRSVSVDAKKTEITVKDTQEANALDQSANDKVTEFTEKVKDTIKEELGVSDEQIEEAMEELGYTYLDLTNSNNLANLIGALTGTEDAAMLLTDEAFATIASKVSDFALQLTEQTGVSLDLLKEMTPVEDETVPSVDIPLQDASEIAEESTISQDESNLAKDDLLQPQEDVMAHPTEVVVEEVIADIDESGLGKSVKTTDQNAKSSDEVLMEEVDASEEKTSDATVEVNTSNATDAGAEENTSEHANDNAQANAKNVKMDANPTNATTSQMQMTQTVDTQATQATVELPSGETVSVREIVDQIVEAARTTISSEKTTMEVLLNPEGLGKILMEVSEENGQVKAHIYTENVQVKEALENQMFTLKEQMNQSGTKVTSIEVSVAAHEFERNLEEGQQGQEEQERSQDDRTRRMRNLDLNNLDELQGLMTEEEELVAKIMRDNGNSVNFSA